jgi:small subunit ribosomal protein S15
MSVTKERKSELIQDYGRTGGDTGSPEVQIAILTSRIADMRTNPQSYLDLLRRLDIRK